MTSRSCWKSGERRAAKALGGQRIPCSGAGDIKGDVLHDKFFIECKTRQSLSIYPWMLKAIEQAKPSGKIPILVVRKKATREMDIVCIRLTDFAALANYAPKPNYSQQIINGEVESNGRKSGQP